MPPSARRRNPLRSRNPQKETLEIANQVNTPQRFATVQEAIAAQIPFVVNHIVPGQEEGNIALIQQTAIGALAAGRAEHVVDIVKGAIANDGALGRAWRRNLLKLLKPSASRAIARFLLEKA